MKNNIRLIFCFNLFFAFGTFVSFGQAPNWAWAQSISSWGQLGDNRGNAAATDATGNVYTCGSFNSGPPGFTSAGNRDMFLAKYDPSGLMLWHQTAGGGGNDYATDVAVDGLGNVCVTGFFYSPTFVIGTTTLINPGSLINMFVAKYDANGNFLWATSKNNAGGGSIAMDGNGNCYVTGDFRGITITFGSTTLTNTDNTGITGDMFIVKYDQAGNVLWAKSAEGSNMDTGTSVATDQFGNVFVTGGGNSPTIVFGTITLSTTTGNIDFLVKYNASGTVQWANNNGGTDVTIDSANNIYVAGYFSSATFLIGSTTLTSIGGTDVFIIKLDETGVVIWARSGGSINNDYIGSVATDIDGNIYITGTFNGPTIVFDTTTNLTGSSNNRIFLAKYNSSGNFNWVKIVASWNDVGSNDVATYNSNVVYITGWYKTSIPGLGGGLEFEPNITIPGLGEYDMFVAKMDATLGIQDQNAESTLNIYPTFANTNITIKANSKLIGSTYFICDIMGKIIMENKLTNEISNLRIDNISSGLYFLRIDKQNCKSYKFVKD